MRTSLIVLTLGLSLSASAQLLNGGFEGSGDGDISGWLPNCSLPTLVPSDCPAGGEWGIQVESGHNNGCNNGMLIQKLPTIADGEAFTLSGWCRYSFCTGAPFIGFGMGIVNNGSYVFYIWPQSEFAGWHEFSITHTYELNDGDTAMVFLNPGNVNYPQVLCYALFDELLLVPENGTGLVDEATISGTSPIGIYPNPAVENITINTASPVERIFVTDALGRVQAMPPFNRNDSRLKLDVRSLAPGPYTISLNSKERSTIARFVKY